jgi:3,4-dihydroxy 2-butanone 4-phosphate synthase/GTP cyclohydrolase II
MTNNPAKYGGLEGYGLDIIERVPLEPIPNPENVEYLRTKRDRMGHLFADFDMTASGLGTEDPLVAAVHLGGDEDDAAELDVTGDVDDPV